MSLEVFDVDIARPSGVRVYELGESFWRLFEHSFVEKGQLTATVSTHKLPSSIQLLFNIQGEVVLVCDRSLEVFDYPIHVEKKVDFKWGHENKELEEDVYMIDQHADTINIAQHLYDFICLAIPMKKIHPQHSVMNERKRLVTQLKNH